MANRLLEVPNRILGCWDCIGMGQSLAAADWSSCPCLCLVLSQIVGSAVVLETSHCYSNLISVVVTVVMIAMDVDSGPGFFDYLAG